MEPAGKVEKIYNLTNSFLELLKKLWKRLRSNEDRYWNLRPYEVAICGLYVKSFKSARAILTLCKEGCTEDAFIILRSVYEGTVKALWILKEDSEKRAERFEDYTYFDQYRHIQKMLEVVEKQEGNNSQFYQELLQAKNEKEEEIKERNLESKYGVKLGDKFELNPSGIYGRSEDTGFLKEYHHLYWKSSMFAHSDALSLNEYFDDSSGRVSFYDGPNWELVPEVLIHLNRMLLPFAYKFDEIFDLKLNQEIQQYDSEINEFIKKEML